MNSKDVVKVGFIPFAAPGHMNPLMYIARIFARQGFDVSYFTTNTNALRFRQDVENDLKSGFKIKIHTLSLPFDQVGLPPGVETFSEATSNDMFPKLMTAFNMLESQIEQFLSDNHFDCIVSDVIHSWTTDAAMRLGIPRLAFHCSGYMGQSIPHSIMCYAPHEKVESDFEPFVLPGLPHKIEITRSQVPYWFKTTEKSIIEAVEKMEEANLKSHGILINSFYELEPDYVKYFQTSVGIRSWAIGPVSLWIDEENVKTGNEKLEVIEWLDSKEPNSVLYVSFGSMAKLPNTQLLEIAHALEDSGHQFIWVIGKKGTNEEEEEDYLPGGFEERMKQEMKGLLIRNWAPQILILNHEAIGGFLTHCGWNSTIESVLAGQPMISWPLAAEQFFNEKLVTQVLKIAVSVGSKRWFDDLYDSEEAEIINREEIKKAITVLMSDVEGLRERARELKCAANKAISNGGSSHTNLVSLIDELKLIKSQRQVNQINYNLYNLLL